MRLVHEVAKRCEDDNRIYAKGIDIDKEWKSDRRVWFRNSVRYPRYLVEAVPKGFRCVCFALLEHLG